MKKIPNIPGYYVDKNGDVFSIRTGKLLKMKPWIDRDGYRLITFSPYVVGRKKTYKVSRLIAKTYLNNFTDNCIVMHLNNVRNDDRLENLKVGTFEDNHLQKIRENRQAHGTNIGTSKLKEKDVVDIKKLLKNGILKSHIAKTFNVSKTLIGYISYGKIWKHIK